MTSDGLDLEYSHKVPRVILRERWGLYMILLLT